MKGIRLQSYPREENSLAKLALFPRQEPKLPLDAIKNAIRAAFNRAQKNKSGEKRNILKSPEELVNSCLRHLKKRSDPIISPQFFSQLNVKDVFDMDAIPHEMQRQRMNIGIYYQFLMIELMRYTSRLSDSNIIQVFDGSREGDAVVDIRTPTFDKGLRLYISVKKSKDTVGGQDIPGVITRLERIAETEKNRTSPYMCVIAITTPDQGKLRSYESSRKIKNNNDGYPYSPNCEVWMPGFLYPYITGHDPRIFYEESIKVVNEYFQFHTLVVREEAIEILKAKFIELGISDYQGNININKFFEFVVH